MVIVRDVVTTGLWPEVIYGLSNISNGDDLKSTWKSFIEWKNCV